MTKYQKIILFILLGYIVLVVSVYIYFFGYVPTNKHEHWRSFATYFSGLIGPLLSFAAFAAVLYTISQNEKNNKLQSAKNNIIKQIEFHNNILNGLSLTIGKSNIKKGREVFEYLFDKGLRTTYEEAVSIIKTKNEPLRIETAYINLFEQQGGTFGYYFRNLYRVVKYIDQSDIAESEKIEYSKLLRAQLSKHEILMLFYNSMSSKGKEKFYDLVVNHSLLKEIEAEHLLAETHWNLYPPKAYGL